MDAKILSAALLAQRRPLTVPALCVFIQNHRGFGLRLLLPQVGNHLVDALFRHAGKSLKICVCLSIGFQRQHARTAVRCQLLSKIGARQTLAIKLS
jgi:hypothetical protein